MLSCSIRKQMFTLRNLKKCALVTYKTNEKKADLIEKVRHARVRLRDESYDQSKRCHVISSSEYQSPYENCSTCTFIKGPIFLFYYDERKERLRYLLLHILFFLEAFAIHLHAIFLQKIISVMIAIYSLKFIRLLRVVLLRE